MPAPVGLGTCRELARGGEPRGRRDTARIARSRAALGRTGAMIAPKGRDRSAGHCSYLGLRRCLQPSVTVSGHQAIFGLGRGRRIFLLDRGVGPTCLVSAGAEARRAVGGLPGWHRRRCRAAGGASAVAGVVRRVGRRRLRRVGGGGWVASAGGGCVASARRRRCRRRRWSWAIGGTAPSWQCRSEHEFLHRNLLLAAGNSARFVLTIPEESAHADSER